MCFESSDVVVWHLKEFLFLLFFSFVKYSEVTFW